MESASELDDLLERFLSAPAADRTPARRALMRALKLAAAGQEPSVAAAVIERMVAPPLDYTTLQTLGRLQRSLHGRIEPLPQSIKLAVLSSFTTDQLVPLIELFLWAQGVELELYGADYGVFRQEILDPTSGLYAFGANFGYLALTWRDLLHAPEFSDSHAAVEKRVADELAEWTMLWDRLHEGSGCQVLQDNFAAPAWRAFGNHELAHPGSFGRYCGLVNEGLQRIAPAFVSIHDVDHLAATEGRRAFGDERFYHHAKLPCAPEALVDYAHSVASVLAAQLGLSKKCLVLDLDDTLWGGVVGDVGLGGIRLGQNDAEGEAFVAFQHYVRALQRRGVILAVCSANEEANAREVFTEHTEMVLKLEDISCFVANWDDKATNVRRIARELDIGLQSMVFLDDTPGQRALVRRLVPEVSVPEVSGDPVEYIQTIERMRYFQVAGVGQEDLERTQLYRANAERKKSRASSADVDGFLQSLEMIAHVQPIGPQSIERSVQLINKSNQFNLTTRRYTTAEMAARLDQETWITRTVRLTDRFGDNGLISIVLACAVDGRLEIDTWLMSCRVLRRGVEAHLMNHLFGLARTAGMHTILGRYLPTAKNTLVAEHYAKLGFNKKTSDEDGGSTWELAVDDTWQPLPTFIQDAEHDG